MNKILYILLLSISFAGINEDKDSLIREYISREVKNTIANNLIPLIDWNSFILWCIAFLCLCIFFIFIILQKYEIEFKKFFIYMMIIFFIPAFYFAYSVSKPKKANKHIINNINIISETYPEIMPLIHKDMNDIESRYILQLIQDARNYALKKLHTR